MKTIQHNSPGLLTRIPTALCRFRALLSTALLGIILVPCTEVLADDTDLLVGLQTLDPNTYSATIAGLTISNSMAAPFGCFYAYFQSYGYNTGLHLNIGATYTLDVKRFTLPSPCGGITNSISVFPSCADAYVNGVKLGSTHAYVTTDLVNSESHFQILLAPQDITFSWDFPKDGLQALVADGQSWVHGSVTPGHGTVTWAWDGPDLGCTFLGDSSGVTVSAGTNTGTVLLKGTSGGTTCYEIPLDLVDCSACSAGTCQGGGALSVNNASVEMRLGLGWALLGNTAGYLEINESAPTNTIATPAALHYKFKRPEVQVFSNTSGLLQVKAPELFVNITTNSATKYYIQLFSLTNVVAPTNGGYQLSGSPYRTITVENPSADTNHVLITDSNDGSTYDYTWQSTGWLLATGGGLRNELRTSVSSGSQVTISNAIWTGSSAPASVKVETYQTSGAYYGRRLTNEVFGSGAAARTNTYTYTANGFLQQAIRWDGSWEYYLYDSYNRPTNIFAGFLNQGVTTNSSLCRLTEHNYSTNVISGAGDTGTNFFRTPRRTIEYIQGVEAARKYFVGLAGQRRDIQCVTPGAAWNDSHNLVTTTTLFTNSFHLNEPQVVARPDGTADIYQYGPIGSSTTNIVLTGHLDSTGTNIDAGTETILILGSVGQLLSKTVIDIQSTMTTAQENYFYDNLDRLTNTVFLDGTSAQRAYDCCTVSSETDRDGTVTSYTYDALKRLLTTTRNSVTSSNTYDPAGNILATTRFGSDGSAIINSQTAFDNSRRQTSGIDALGQSTSYTNYIDGSGQLVRVTTRPDLSTRIETLYADGSLQRITGTAAFPIRYQYGTEDDGTGVTNFYTKEIKLDQNGSDTTEWAKTYKDAAGRTYKTVYAAVSGTPASLSYFNANGQLTNQLDPDGVSTLYAFNLKGEQTYTILDSNRNSAIDFSGADRITFVTNDVVADNSTNVRRTRTYVWNTSADSSNLVSTTETSVDSLQSWNTVWNNGVGVTSHSKTTYDPAHGYRIITNTAPDSSYAVTTNLNGRPISVTRYDSLKSQLSALSYSYDPHGRQNIITDARNGATTNFFNNADQISGIAAPLSQISSNFFDNMGRIFATRLPDNTYVTNQFSLTGLLTNTFGSRNYPVGYTYDAQGRVKTMTTWISFTNSAGPATTTWNYDVYRGFLTNKTYADGKGPVYTYSAAGRLASRLWARGITTTYAYNNAGDLASISYSDGLTSGVTNSYDRRGRAISLQSEYTISRTYDDAGDLLSESTSGGSGGAVTNAFDQFLRRTNLAAYYSSSPLSSTAYKYDSASRLASVSDGTNSATYTYLANSPLVGQIAFTNNGVQRMMTTKQFDSLNRLAAISNLPSAGGQPFISFAYSYNSANQRTAVTNADSAYWVYQYDPLGQVTSGKKYWSDGTPVAGEQFQYGFDDIGNRKTASSGGDQWGANLRYQNYSANNLNQYTSRTVSGYFNDIGAANSNSTVTLWRDNGSYAMTSRKGEFYRAELPLDNSTGAVWLTLTNLAVLNNGTNADIITNSIGNAFVPQTPESFLYDLDGNLTNDGRWTYTWDGENRLTHMVGNTNTPSASNFRLDFRFDPLGRRIKKDIAIWNGSGYLYTFKSKFLYDGWNLIAWEAISGQLLSTFMWGSDLSGAMQGAGGVGGLLAINNLSNSVHFAAFDGNGNVTALVNATNGSISAQYEYGPFGELLRATGPMSKLNAIRFSTKYQDDESDFYYYGYRYYNPGTGRWLSRDPVEEQGGANIYSFGGNNAESRLDVLGLMDQTTSTFVAKSFIKGIPTLGSLFGRQGWDPLTEPPPFGGSLPDGWGSILQWLPHSIPSSGLFADIRLAAFSLGIRNLSAFNEDPPSDAKDGRYRLYTRVSIQATCCDERPTIKITTDSAGGVELGPISGTINISSDLTQTDEGVDVHWRGWGSPNMFVEPGMQWVARRSSLNIWHDVVVKVSCREGKAAFDFGNVTRSKFPSLRIWQDGNLKKDLGQGALSDLWQPDPRNFSFVAP